ncbi:N-acetyltransferase [Neobacillus niacini]|uniref:GNAT family N-acetyltransferase n=1 Tax=Neobacillus niacini TaxID=86668 RepID=UPI0021CB1B5E|nr:GNAT family N-acetyltransferase [Neobacillus niacini]MCM3763832.1 GNAT family N-acetyltransferase [Neobacillus niacini]
MRLMMYCKTIYSDRPLPLPPGFSIRTFRPGDETTWAKIETLAGEFATVTEALQRFHSEFHGYESDLQQRCFFLQNPEGEAIGTIMAWYGEYQGRKIGRIHWVGIVPDYQGKKLAKPLLTYALAEMSKYHQEGYLTTQKDNERAIRLYEAYGFYPIETA